MIIKELVPDVVGVGELSPTQVVKAVQARIPNRFTSDDFQRAWKKLGCPAADQLTAPERTDKKTWETEDHSTHPDLPMSVALPPCGSLVSRA